MKQCSLIELESNNYYLIYKKDDVEHIYWVCQTCADSPQNVYVLETLSFNCMDRETYPATLDAKETYFLQSGTMLEYFELEKEELINLTALLI